MADAPDVTEVSTNRLAEMWVHGELNTDAYLADIERRAPLMVEAMIRDERQARRRRG